MYSCDKDRVTVEAADELLYMEKLASLKGLRDGQYSLQSVRMQVETHYKDYCECHQLVDRCGAELEKLEREKNQLISRLEQIDNDKMNLSAIREELENECSVLLHSAPTDDYEQVASCVNQERRVFGMEPLADCQPRLQILSLLSQELQRRRHIQGRGNLKPSLQQNKAGPSFKICPHCKAVVSRNAVVCGNCKCCCSRPGHKNGKKT